VVDGLAREPKKACDIQKNVSRLYGRGKLR